MSAVPIPIQPIRRAKRYPRLARLEVRPPRNPCADAIAGMSGEELLMLRSVGGRLPRLRGHDGRGELVRAGYELAAEAVPQGGFIRQAKRRPQSAAAADVAR